MAKSETSGAMVVRPNPKVAFTFSAPRGVAPLLETASSMSRRSSRILVACDRYVSPSLVRLRVRVLRFTRRTPRRRSISARRLVAAGGVKLSSRAAADRLPSRARWMKNSSSDAMSVFTESK
ncbi:hypothetical protein D3C71_1345880 [compost metagenome]